MLMAQHKSHINHFRMNRFKQDEAARAIALEESVTENLEQFYHTGETSEQVEDQLKQREQDNNEDSNQTHQKKSRTV